MRINWAPAVLRAAGLTIVETPGCYGRGRELAHVQAIVNHGTGTPDGSKAWTAQRLVDLLIKGRPDLPGPLSQFGLDWDGVWWFVADGRCNHNGHGTFGNDAIGVEAFGTSAFTPAQLISWKRGNAAVLNHLGYAADRAWGHKETDPRRKPDPIGVDMAAFRADVGLYQHELKNPSHQEDPVTDEDIKKITGAVADEVIKRLSEDMPTSKASERLKKAAHAAQHLHDHAGLKD